MGSSDLTNKIKSIAPTPLQLVALFTAVAGIDVLDKASSGGIEGRRISEKLFQGDLGRAWEVLSENAQSFMEGGAKAQEVKKLIVNSGVATLTITLLQMIVNEFRGMA